MSEKDWIPLTMREMDEEEKQSYIDMGYPEIAEDGKIFDCELPDDGQEVLITLYGRYVVTDTFVNDGNMGCYFEGADIEDVTAWMPLPAPYEPQESEVRNDKT